jgi:hypothetical protein
VGQWQRLDHELEANKVRMSREQAKIIFSITEDEINPFSSAKSSSGDLQSLVKSFLTCE